MSQLLGIIVYAIPPLRRLMAERDALRLSLRKVEEARWEAVRAREEAENARWAAVRAREEAEAVRWDAVRLLGSSDPRRPKIVTEMDQPRHVLDRLAALEDLTARLQSIIDYSVIRDLRLIEFNHDFYFHYTADALGQAWMSSSRESAALAVAERRARWSKAALEKPTLSSVDTLLLQPPNTFTLLLPVVMHLLHHHPTFAFIDVGANIGITSMPIARLIKDAGRSNRIFAFEPGHTAELFSWNVRMNAMDDIMEAIPAAVSSFNGVAPIRALARHSESVSLQDFTKHYPQLFHSEVRLVPVFTLDDFAKTRRIDAPLFIKIDAEGEDCQVVEGMQRLLASGQVLGAMVEITGKYMTENEFLRLARSFENFTMVNMRTLDVEGTHGFYETIDDDALATLYRTVAASPHGWTDVLFMRQTIPGLPELIARLQRWR
jgi:FkbM family methyltransferase